MITFRLKTRHFNEDCALLPGYYPKADPADPQQVGWRCAGLDGGPIGQPTVNLWDPPVFPAEGCVWIKVTREYGGWLESLIAAGLVEPTGRVSGAGLVERYAAECRVLMPELLEVRQ